MGWKIVCYFRLNKVYVWPIMFRIQWEHHGESAKSIKTRGVFQFTLWILRYFFWLDFAQHYISGCKFSQNHLLNFDIGLCGLDFIWYLFLLSLPDLTNRFRRRSIVFWGQRCLQISQAVSLTRPMLYLLFALIATNFPSSLLAVSLSFGISA